jgi:drug/metabolite transporter (DMT)-like permease
MQRLRFAAVLSLAVVAVASLLAQPALAQQTEGPNRLNWFWSIFAGFVLAGIGIAIVAWFFNLTRVHWSFVLILWIVVTLFLRYDTNIT